MSSKRSRSTGHRDIGSLALSWLAMAAGLVVLMLVTGRVVPAQTLPTSGPSMVLKNFDGTTVPTNLGGDQYPSWSDGKGGEGGFFIGSIDIADAISGHSFMAHLVAQAGTGNALYAQFNPYDEVGRGFARDYSVDPAHWQFNTYNRLSIWIKFPSEPTALYHSDGTSDGNIAGYAKCIALPGCPDPYSDETGGGHMYFNMNWPRTGTWVHVLLNTWPDHWRGNQGGQEEPNALHATGEANYNLFDTFTRFYIQEDSPALHLPADYRIDEIKFYQETNTEAEEQVRSLSATYVPQTNRVIVTWFRNKDENSVNHEVRYAFSDIHQLGWNNATPAPNGVVVPPGYQGYNGMFYDTTALPLTGKTVVYLAIRPTANNPQNLFTQVAIPLNIGSQQTPPAAPTNVRIIR